MRHSPWKPRVAGWYWAKEDPRAGWVAEYFDGEHWKDYHRGEEPSEVMAGVEEGYPRVHDWCLFCGNRTPGGRRVMISDAGQCYVECRNCGARGSDVVLNPETNCFEDMLACAIQRWNLACPVMLE